MKIHLQRLKYLTKVIIFIITLHGGIVYAQQFERSIFVSDGPGTNLELIIGFYTDATDGFDQGLDIKAPPPPPAGNFDARILNDVSIDNFFKDIRKSTTEEVIFKLSYQAATGQGPVIVRWDASQFQGLGRFEILDNITGGLFGPVDMTTIDSLDVSTASPFLDSGLRIRVNALAVGIEDEIETMQISDDFILYPNFPNPFNGITQIRFHLAKSTDIELKIFNALGQNIKTLAQGNFSKGLHYLKWDGTAANGFIVPSGYYFAQIISPSNKNTVKLFFIK